MINSDILFQILETGVVMSTPKTSSNIITPKIYMRSINCDTSNHLTSEGFIGWSGAVIVAARTTTIIRLLTLERERERDFHYLG